MKGNGKGKERKGDSGMGVVWGRMMDDDVMVKLMRCVSVCVRFNQNELNNEK